MYFSPLAMRELVAGLGPRTRRAVGALLPGPVTLVIANPERRYPLACREDPERLGVRLIEGPLAGAMTPIFQTSANRSGAEPPDRIRRARPRGPRRAADLAIDAGELIGAPSTVVDIGRPGRRRRMVAAAGGRARSREEIEGRLAEALAG